MRNHALRDLGATHSLQHTTHDREVLIVDDGMPGGIQRITDYLLAEWAQQPDAPRVRRMSLRGTGSLTRALPRYARALATLDALLLTRRIRLLHVNLTQRGSTWRALPIVAMARSAGVPVILHLHSSEYDQFLASLGRAEKTAVRRLFNAAARVVVLGANWAEVVRHELQVDAARILVLPNAVPGPHDAPPTTLRRGTRLLFLGQLGERKGVPDLLAALASSRLADLQWEATLAGDGDVEAYRALAQSTGLGERVTFTGWVDAVEVQRQLTRSDVLVLPSHAEGLPLAVLEGLAHGLAVISTPVGAIPDVIEDDVTGLLVPPGDVNALSDALAKLVEQFALRARLGRNARAVWERDYTPERYAARVSALYDEVAPLAAPARG